MTIHDLPRPIAAIRRLWTSRRGTGAVEFALMAPFLLVATSGLVDYGRSVINEMELASAVRAGAQFAIADSDDTTAIGAAVVGATNLALTAADVTANEFCECADGTPIGCGGGCFDGSANRYYMTVTANYAFTPFFLAAQTLTGSITVRTR